MIFSELAVFTIIHHNQLFIEYVQHSTRRQYSGICVRIIKRESCSQFCSMSGLVAVVLRMRCERNLSLSEHKPKICQRGGILNPSVCRRCKTSIPKPGGQVMIINLICIIPLRKDACKGSFQHLHVKDYILTRVHIVPRNNLSFSRALLSRDIISSLTDATSAH